MHSSERGFDRVQNRAQELAFTVWLELCGNDAGEMRVRALVLRRTGCYPSAPVARSENWKIGAVAPREDGPGTIVRA